MSSPNPRRDAAAHALLAVLPFASFQVIYSSFVSAVRGEVDWSGFGFAGMIVIALGVQLWVIYRTRADDFPAGTEAGPTRPRIGLKGLIALVAVCGFLFWLERSLWDLRPENAPMRGLRNLRSSDPATRARGARDLDTVFILDRPATTPEQAGALVDALLIALRDDHAAVRVEATSAILHLANKSVQRSGPIPRFQAVVAGLAERLGDDAPAVRWQAAQALCDIYFRSPKAKPYPLPSDPPGLVAALRRALGDPDPRVPAPASLALGAITPRLGESPPPEPVSASGSKYPEARAEADVAPSRSRPPEGAQPGGR
jgi:hypothetical protein